MMLTLLYVDDEPSLLETCRIFLERDGRFSVDTITSAPAALDLMGSRHYDAIISDYQMPGMDGIELLKRVRSTGNPVPFILFTGRGREEVVIQALNEGADYYLQKGGDPRSQFAELSHKVIQAVRQRNAETSIRDLERREQDIINFLPDATFAIDTKGIVIAWNRAMEAMTGVPAKSILGRGDHEYALPFYRERRPLLIDQVLKNDPAAESLYPYIRRDGKTLRSEIRIPHMNNGNGAWLWFTASPLYDNQNAVVGAIESIRDITEMKMAQDEIQAQAEELQASFLQLRATEDDLRHNLGEITRGHEALRASEERYRRIVNTANEGIWAMDRDLRTTFVNQRMADILGYTCAEMQGRTVDSFMVADERADHEVRLRERRSGKRGKYERRFVRRDGTIIWAEVSSTPLFTDTGEFDGSFAMFTDITGRKEAEAALNRKIEALNASYEQITATEEELRQNYDELRQFQDELHMSRDLYRAVFENTGTATVLIDEDTVIRIANGQFAALAGFPRDEIEGRKSWTEFVVPEDLDRMRDQHRLRRDASGGASGHYEFRFVTRTGDIHNILLTIGMVPGTRQSIASLLDITARRRADDEMCRIAQEWQRTFDATDDAIWILDRDQRIVRSNRTAGRILNRPCREFIGKHCWEILHGTDTAIPGCPCMRARESLHRETMEIGAGGRWFEVTVDPIADGDGRFAGAVHIISDITDRRRAEDSLRQANRQLAMLTGVTRHDIQNQILTMLGFIEVAKMQSPEPALADIIGKLEEATKRIRSQIMFTKSYQDLGSQKPRWLAIESLVQGLDVPPAIRIETGIRDVEIYADPMLEKVFSNLLDNTLRHGGKATTIRVSAEEMDGGLVLTWEDDGIGIPADEKELIFERGYGRNTGLGLSLVREILAITGITITEDGRPGAGARFVMRVPEGSFRLPPCDRQPV